MFRLLRHFPLRSVIPNVAPSVKRRQTSIVLILVSHWRKDFLSISAKTSWVHRNFLFRPWTLCVYRGEAAYVYLLHRFVIFSFLTSHNLHFLCRTYRAGIDAPFRVLCFSSCSSSFPFLDFLKSQWACFHWWVFLYRKVRERWVMQVPLSLLCTFFQKLLPLCLPKLFSGPVDEKISSNTCHL